MSQQTARKQPGDLNRSIDIGLDQFGRFLRIRWLFVLIMLLIIWYVVTNLVPTLRPPTPALLLQIGLQISFALLFVGVQFFMWFYLMGRARVYWVMPGETGVSFDDYKGNPEVLEAAKRMVALLQGVEDFEKMGGKPIRGLLLSGPPGTGKSYLSQCISTEAHVPFGYISAASLRGIFMGMDVLAIRRLYTKARRLAREYGASVVFLDEIDAIGASRSSGPSMGMGFGGMMGGMGSGTGGLNELLMQMDPPNIETGWFKKILRLVGMYQGKVQSQPVLTIGATNLPEVLDRALLRPGRFDRQVHIAPPTDKYRPEVIEYYLNKVKHVPGISVAKLSARLVDYTPVAIKHVVNEATIIAHFSGRDKITYADLIEAQDIHEYGLRQVSEMTEVDRRRIAYHEAGHAVATHYLYDRFFPAYVTIQMRSDLEGALAFAHPRPKETVLTQTREDILANIQISLAARASEELFLNTQMSGVTSDFMSATRVAARYIAAFGMDGTILSLLNPVDFTIPLNDHKLAERVEALLQSQMRAVKQLLMDHREALIAIAHALMERNELLADDIKEIIEAADARKAAQAVFSEFMPLLEAGNGRPNNGNGNGHVIEAGNGSGSHLPDRDRTP